MGGSSNRERRYVMYNANRPATRAFPIALAAVVWLAVACAPAQQPVSVIHMIDQADVMLTARMSSTLAAIDSDPTTVRIQLARIEFAPLMTADQAQLDLGPSLAVRLDTTRVDRRAENDFSWYGTDVETGSSAVFVVKAGDVMGSIRSDGTLYRVSPLADGVHAVVEVNEDKFPPDHPPEFKDIEAVEREPPGQRTNTRDMADSAPCPHIRVLVAYTPQAAAESRNIEAEVQLAIAETNDSYFRSNVDTEIVLAYSYRVSYSESGDIERDLAAFRTLGDSLMDEIHDLRITEFADIAVLIIGRTAQACGYASAILCDTDTAFAVVSLPCATGHYSFGHEVGHLQGARHNPEVDNRLYPFPYGHGYQQGKWRTVMSYQCPRPCPRLPFWSNPDLSHNGAATGMPNLHNNARVLNETACTLAGFMPEP
jgi:hypothetical protein